MSLRTSAHAGVAIRSPLAPSLGELAAKPTERVNIALSAPSGHLSHRERQVALIRLALAGDARATFPGGEGFEMRIATPVCGLVRNDMHYTIIFDNGEEPHRLPAISAEMSSISPIFRSPSP